MNRRRHELLKAPAINGWNLLRAVTAPISIAVLIAAVTAELSSGEGFSSLVQFSVRCAVPLLFVVFAASSIQVLFPGSFGRWLLRNREYLGLSFAAAMAWQGIFILWLVVGHTEYYVEEVYVLRDAIEGIIGYTFRLAMNVTSFPRGRRHLNPGKWRILHLSGIYFLWAYAFSTIGGPCSIILTRSFSTICFMRAHAQPGRCVRPRGAGGETSQPPNPAQQEMAGRLSGWPGSS
ncbi:MAG: hypothetical protein WD448_07450 [Woeseia sp.]